MGIWRQWVDLWHETFRSIDRDDVAELYSRHWMPAQDALVAHDREAIDGETRRWRRFLRTANAVVFGLTRRLAPVRRLILGLALAVVAASLLAPVSWSFHSDRWRVTFDLQGLYLLVGFLLLLLLLGMELVDKLRFRDELELARDLQADLLPRQLPPAPGFEIAAFNRIANTVGGDLYDFAPLPGGGLALLFGDASGHGMAAGLVMAVAHAAFRTQLEIDPSPEAVVAALNRILCRTGGPRSFFACAYSVWDADGSFRIAFAGHPPALRVGPDGAVRERLGRGAYPLGIKEDALWGVETGRLERGETLILHSDGVTEARNRAGDEFGDARVEAAIARMPARPPEEIVAAVAADVAAFCGRVSPEDDISVAAVRQAL